MTRILPFSILPQLAWGLLAREAPADPTITPRAELPRQNNAQYIGWAEYNGTWTSLDCNPGFTWYQDGKYAQCCPTTLASCYAPTACVGGSLIYPYSDLSTTATIACVSNYGDPRLSICNTAFIFENTGDSNPKTDIICGDSSVNWSFYRVIPDSFTQTSASPTSTPDATTTPSSSPSSPSTPENTDPTTPKKSSSKAWIAGVVVGPLIGIALLAGLIFLLIRRKKKASNPPIQPTASFQPSNPQPPVAQYNNDMKPAFAPQVSPGQQSPGNYNPNDPYNQQIYAQQPLSPAPQYTAPYMAPGSPPPQSPPPQKVAMVHEQQNVPQPMAAELGGVSSPAGGGHTAELDGGIVQK